MNILIPIFLVALVPLLLWLGGMLKLSPSLRFMLAGLIVIFIWTGISIFLLTGDEPLRAWYWFCGCLFIGSAMLTAFMPWSVLCWGYTLTMLLRIAESNSFLSEKAWQELYAGTKGIQGLTINRMTILTDLRLAKFNNESVLLTKMGEKGADILKNVSQFFGIFK